MVIGFCLSVIGYWLLVIGCCWLVIEADLSIQQVQSRTFLFFKFTRAALECPFFLSRLFSSWKLDLKMGVFKNRGTPKSSILIGFSIINHPFWGTPIFGNTQIKIVPFTLFFHGFRRILGARNIPCCPYKDGMSPKTHLFFAFKWRVVKGYKGPFLLSSLVCGMEFIIVLTKLFEKTTRLFGSVSTHLSAPQARTKSRVGSSDSCLILFKAVQASYPP